VRQITRKWYNIELYLQWPTNRKSYDLLNGAILMTLNDPYPNIFKITSFFDTDDSETIRDTAEGMTDDESRDDDRDELRSG